MSLTAHSTEWAEMAVDRAELVRFKDGFGPLDGRFGPLDGWTCG